ncbi:collagen-like protein [Candidatus Pacearchaeota archaeon]|nr:collagen-like protein [Candidatus Pacearchaeota archaeon]
MALSLQEKVKILKKIKPKKPEKELLSEYIKGDPGPQGLQGPQGPRGMPGTTGKTGRIGSPGRDGLQGLYGPQGTPGKKGIQGEKGLQGERGKEGSRGEKGSRGTPGAGGSSRLRITPSDGDIILSDRDQVILAEGDITVTLPAPTDGKTYHIKNIGTGVITVAGTIDGDTDFDLIRHEAIHIVSDGTGWWIL